jgi:hypothetical protein
MIAAPRAAAHAATAATSIRHRTTPGPGSPSCARRLPTLLIVAVLLVPSNAWSHGYAGNRIFPTTFEVDDPFVMDEFSLLVSHLKESGTAEVPSQLGTGISADYTARIIEHWGIIVGGEFRRVEPDGGDAMHGFGNLLVGTKYQFFTSHVHEAIASIGVDAAVGNTGDQRIGYDPVSVVYPTFFFGKGMGDLPASANFWRPLAVTGTFGAGFPTATKSLLNLDNPQGPKVGTGVTANPTKLIWGLTVQYSLQYLQNFLQDVGLTRPFNQMVPVVEVAMESCLNGFCGGQTDGTINPGLIWFGDYFQLGLAAQIPVNSRTGSNVGVLALFHLFVDDLLGDHEHEHEQESARPMVAPGRRLRLH